MYKVTEYTGDYPIESQVFWAESFYSLEAAKSVAKLLYYYPDDLKRTQSEDYYVLVERVPNDGEVEAVEIVYTKNGPLRFNRAVLFLAQYEQRERVEDGESGEFRDNGEGGENGECNGAREIHVYNHPAYNDYSA